MSDDNPFDRVRMAALWAAAMVDLRDRGEDPDALVEAATRNLIAYGPDVLADNARLRGLVKEAEREGRHESEVADICPWCHFVRGFNGVEFKKTHAADCPAFTTDGEVR